ncbi:MAG: flagellar hook-length control protein FliK [Thermoguttaceae bacterium]|nr:flagellar hook-length control protein FliK [Thermoguttaceae bacterium]
MPSVNFESLAGMTFPEPPPGPLAPREPDVGDRSFSEHLQRAQSAAATPAEPGAAKSDTSAPRADEPTPPSAGTTAEDTAGTPRGEPETPATTCSGGKPSDQEPSRREDEADDDEGAQAGGEAAAAAGVTPADPAERPRATKAATEAAKVRDSDGRTGGKPEAAAVGRQPSGTPSPTSTASTSTPVGPDATATIEGDSTAEPEADASKPSSDANAKAEPRDDHQATARTEPLPTSTQPPEFPAIMDKTEKGRAADGTPPEATGGPEPRSTAARRSAGRSAARSAASASEPDGSDSTAQTHDVDPAGARPAGDVASGLPATESTASPASDHRAAGNPGDAAGAIEPGPSEAARRPQSAGEDQRATSTDAPRDANTADQADRVRFVQRVAKAFEAAAERGTPLRLRLHPPELGSLRIEVSVRNGAMSARLEAETEAARSVLIDHLPALRERLAEHHLRIERFEVGWSGQSSGGLPQRPGEQPAGHAFRGGPASPSAEPLSPLDPLTAARAARTGEHSHIDFLV